MKVETRALASGSSAAMNASEASTLSKYVAEDGLKRLDEVRAAGGALGDLLRTRTAVGGDEAREVGRDRVGDVDDHLAVERVPEIGHHRRRTGVRTARMTMSPASAAPYVPVVAPAASWSASARALAGSRLTTSTVCPALRYDPRSPVPCRLHR